MEQQLSCNRLYHHYRYIQRLPRISSRLSFAKARKEILTFLMGSMILLKGGCILYHSRWFVLRRIKKDSVSDHWWLGYILGWLSWQLILCFFLIHYGLKQLPEQYIILESWSTYHTPQHNSFIWKIMVAGMVHSFSSCGRLVIGPPFAH